MSKPKKVTLDCFSSHCNQGSPLFVIRFFHSHVFFLINFSAASSASSPSIVTHTFNDPLFRNFVASRNYLLREVQLLILVFNTFQIQQGKLKLHIILLLLLLLVLHRELIIFALLTSAVSLMIEVLNLLVHWYHLFASIEYHKCSPFTIRGLYKMLKTF